MKSFFVKKYDTSLFKELKKEYGFAFQGINARFKKVTTEKPFLILKIMIAVIVFSVILNLILITTDKKDDKYTISKSASKITALKNRRDETIKILDSAFYLRSIELSRLKKKNKTKEDTAFIIKTHDDINRLISTYKKLKNEKH